MPLALAVLVMILLLGGLALFLVVAQRLYRRLQRELTNRGYKSPVVLSLAGTVTFLTTLLGFVAVAAFVGAEEALPFIFVLVLVVPLLFIFALRLLPAGTPRTAGRRRVRFPYRRAGYGLFCAATMLVVGAAVAGAPPLLTGAAMLVVAGLACLEIARRAAVPDASAVLASDARPPVLYLRPFQRDEEIFVEVPRSTRDFWTDWGRNIARKASRRFLTLEEYLKGELSSSIGPFVALGNPLDFVQPDGAARIYVADEEWMARFAELAQRAACTVMIAGISEHVRWELGRLRTMGLQQRLFVLTKPRLAMEAAEPAGRARRWSARLLTRPSRMRVAPPVAWSEFAAALRRAGYSPGDDDPGPGAVVSFDAEGRTLVLMRDARSAVETVGAIAKGMAATRIAAGLE